MRIEIKPTKLSGKIEIPASKSYAHRQLICSALANGVSRISGITLSKDISATMECLHMLGARFKVNGNSVTVSGLNKRNETCTLKDADGTPIKILCCCESGSTLRFLIPIAAALGADARFWGEGRLPERPIDIYTRELSKKGVVFNSKEFLPAELYGGNSADMFGISGKLQSGTFTLEGDVSSQFVTGLMFALPLLDGDSKIVMTSRLESKPYATMTAEILKRYGVEITETDYGYFVKGNQKYISADTAVEGDWSQAAFFYVANILGSNVDLKNLNENSVQGDKKILEIISGMCYNEDRCFDADCSDIPDLVPILAVLGCFGGKTSRIYNASRLRIKESDRLLAVSDMLNRLGGKVSVTDDGLIIEPIIRFNGGEVDSFGDHRIAMCAAIAATRANGSVIINGAESVEKSYPGFFEDYKKVGGTQNVITLE